MHSEPALAPKQIQAGVEYVRPRAVGQFDFIAAVDLHSPEETDWQVSRSFQAGFEFKRTGRRLRLMLEYYHGHSPNGQFYRESLRYTSLGLCFGF